METWIGTAPISGACSTITAGRRHERPSRVRASDHERDRVVRLLWTAAADGRISTEEGAERIDRAYAAVYRDEFGALVDDVPPARAWRGVDCRPSLVGPAGPVVHWLGVLLLGCLTAGIWLWRGPASFWSVLPIATLAVGLGGHAALVHRATRADAPDDASGGSGLDAAVAARPDVRG